MWPRQARWRQVKPEDETEAIRDNTRFKNDNTAPFLGPTVGHSQTSENPTFVGFLSRTWPNTLVVISHAT